MSLDPRVVTSSWNSCRPPGGREFVLNWVLPEVYPRDISRQVVCVTKEDVGFHMYNVVIKSPVSYVTTTKAQSPSTTGTFRPDGAEIGSQYYSKGEHDRRPDSWTQTPGDEKEDPPLRGQGRRKGQTPPLSCRSRPVQESDTTPEWTRNGDRGGPPRVWG